MKSNVVILGLTFKEGTPDIRNSKVEDIIEHLRGYDIEPTVVDPWANLEEAKREYAVELTELKEVSEADCVVFAVAHPEFKALSLGEMDQLFNDELSNDEKIIIDVKSMLDKEEIVNNNYQYWRL